MARPKRICSVANCDKPHFCHGYCKPHVRRWQKYGDPFGGKPTMKGEPERYLQDSVLSFAGDDCLTWPFSTVGGYGRMRVDGRKRIVSHIVCERTHGSAPSCRHEAAHSCGNGHLGCVNPNHLTWKTPEGNWEDRRRHAAQRSSNELA